MLKKVWVYKDIDGEKAAGLAEKAGIPMLLAKVFASRGIYDAESVKSFLRPGVAGLHDPFLMDGMERAADRILKAAGGKENILIYGDYDVDGVAATSILYDYLTSIGAKAQYFLPDREEDGYGLTMTAMEKVRKLGASLIITVDCGITSADEISSLQETGTEVIVTDHHECMETLPDALAVLNPHKPGCGYPFKELCGAGVVLKLVQAVCIKSGCGDRYLKYIDLAALATIADVVPLMGENRIIAAAGLRAMETTRNPGLGALIKTAGLGDKPLTSYGAAFGLAPRVNAAGRLGSAIRGVRLFTAGDMPQAEALAKELDTENRNRQKIEGEIIEEAIKFVDGHLDPAREKVLVVSGKAWHHGVIGIVASKILEKYNRPCIVISVEDGIGKGSGRSLKCMNLFKALNFCKDLLERFGGHEMAAGLTIKEGNIELFRKRINEYADRVLTDTDMLPCVQIDAFLDRADLTSENVNELTLMAPYGAGNPAPVFGYKAFSASVVRTPGDGKHLKMRLTDGSLSVEAIGFNMGGLAGGICDGAALDAIFSPEMNRWNGTEKLQLNLKDIKPCVYAAVDKNIVFSGLNDYNMYYNSIREFCTSEGYCPLSGSELVPSRSEFEAVYRYLRASAGSLPENARGVIIFDDLFELSAVIPEKGGGRINYLKLRRILDIFEELGLLSGKAAGPRGMAVKLVADAKKVRLEDSRILIGLRQCAEC